MNKILITGGAGFIGSTLANKLSIDNEVIVIDDLSMGQLSNLELNDQLTFIKGSVTDRESMQAILSEHRFDYIYHLAAVASVADSVARPVETHEVNFESVLMLLELCRKYQSGLQRLVFSSSAAVYGDEPTLPKNEDSVIRPLTPYAVDKYAAERYVLNYSTLYDLPTSAVRFFNVFGPNQNPDSPYSGVISILLDRFESFAKGEKVNFTIFGDGEQSRDFVYIEDVVKALLLVASSEKSIGEVYNVGTGIATTLTQLIELTRQKTGLVLPTVYQQERAGDIKDSLADISKLTDLGFYPDYTVKSGMEKYIDSIGLK